MKRFAIVVLMLLAGAVHAQETAYQVEVKFGGIGTDNLGGVGGSKAMAEVTSNLCLTFMCLNSSTWMVTEPMDDDIGIVPRKGWQLEATSHPSSLFLYGIRYNKQIDFFTQTSALLGISYGPVRAAILAPLTTDNGTGRWGFAASMRTPINKTVYTVFQYDYYGTQDPDIKVSRVGLGLGYDFK